VSGGPNVVVDRVPFEMIPHWLLDSGVSAHAIRLYLALRRHGDKAGQSFPGRKRLAEALGVSAATLDRARSELRDVGAACERQRLSEDGDWTSNMYHVHWEQDRECILFASVESPPAEPQEVSSPVNTPLFTSDETVSSPVMNELIPNKNSNEDQLLAFAEAPAPTSMSQELVLPLGDDLTVGVVPSDANMPAETTGQRVNRLARTYTDRVKMSNFLAVRSVVARALKADYADRQIIDGLITLADENRPVTIDTLRIAVEGMGRAKGRDRDQEARDRIARFEELDHAIGVR